MRVSIEQAKWWETPFAAFIFFTRLPFWRLHQPPKACYQHVVEYWPLVGWLTGPLMGAIVFVASHYVSLPLAVVMAVIGRVLVTGALHEDGLADFLDGFGGGYDRERILAIMKDSHIGTYGVLGLIFYVALLMACLCGFDPLTLSLTLAVADPFCKMVSAQIILFLPYARKEEEAKAKTVYVRYDLVAGLRLLLTGMLPFAAWAYLMVHYMGWPLTQIEILVAVPGLCFYALYMLMNRKLQGYTGDCCGALFLLTELSFYVALSFLR